MSTLMTLSQRLLLVRLRVNCYNHLPRTKKRYHLTYRNYVLYVTFYLFRSVANAGFNLERLEVIGDSILKLATSIHIYCKSPSHFHEGKMTHLRMKQVCNANLFKLGKSKSIPRFMVATKFLPKENWLSPCYFPNNVDSDVVRKTLHIRILFN